MSMEWMDTTTASSTYCMLTCASFCDEPDNTAGRGHERRVFVRKRSSSSSSISLPSRVDCTAVAPQEEDYESEGSSSKTNSIEYQVVRGEVLSLHGWMAHVDQECNLCWLIMASPICTPRG